MPICSICGKSSATLYSIAKDYIELGGPLVPHYKKLCCSSCRTEVSAWISKQVFSFNSP